MTDEPTGADAGNPAPDPASAPPSDGAVPGLYRPEGIADHLVGATDRDTIDNLFKAYDGARREMSARGSMPKTADEYGFEPGDALNAYFPEPAKDPGLALARAAALKFGITQPQFQGFIAETLGGMAEAGMFVEPYNPQAEVAKIGEALKAAGEAHGKDDIGRVVQQATDFVTVLAEQLKLDEGAKGALSALTDSASGIAALEAIRKSSGEAGIRLGGNAAGQGWTAAKLREAMGDPRYDPQSAKYSADFQKEVDAAYRAFYGNA